MADFGRSDHAGVQAQLDRLAKLSLPQGRFGLDTITALLGRLDDPHRRLPPVFHVAGTNGKGSVCAFLRAMLEADGKRVHVATSPHLVRYNERIRIAGELIADDLLAELLAEVLDACDELAPSFFEVTIAATFLAFAREPADACVIEVGLGGRFDATNVIEHPAACGDRGIGYRSRTLPACTGGRHADIAIGPHRVRESGHRQTGLLHRNRQASARSGTGDRTRRHDDGRAAGDAGARLASERDRRGCIMPIGTASWTCRIPT